MTDWPDAVTFADAWQLSVDRAPADPFLIFEGPQNEAHQSVHTWTYRQFDGLVARCAALLRRHGVGEGCAVSVALTNSPAFVAIWLATIRLGAWLVPSDPLAAEPELTGHLRRTQPVVGFCATQRASTYRRAATNAGELIKLMPVIEVNESDTVLSIFGETKETVWPLLTLTHRAAVMFTSGTTGTPKGVEITQANYAFAGATMAAASSLEPKHRQLVVLPLFHANAQFYSIASAIWAGASVALMHTFSASGFLTQAARHRVTHASLFAAPIRMILSRGAAPVVGVAMQHCWYAMNITHQQHETLSSLLGCRPRQLYGMTETIPAVLSEPADDPVPDSMGRVTLGCRVDLRDGEIVVGGEPGVTLFAGYLDDPASTAANFSGEWFLTGDRAHRGDDGRFWFEGRRSDVLKVAGENVSTVEVEQVIAAFPGILEVAVVGRPDELRDEVAVAFVVAVDPAAPPDIRALHIWCGERLTKVKRPRDITLVDQLPRTSVGKIRKFLLHDETSEGPFSV